ncbi:MAG: class I SAM-dependent methyltransferase [Bacteroidetes bacterium]|nr:class I SAM-dependent methyltransferase [Bacteroidota bacterium]
MYNLKKNLDEFLLGPFYRQFTDTIKKETNDCKTLCDIGCGFYPTLKKVTQAMNFSVGVDAHAPSLEKAKKENIYSEYVCSDIKKYLTELPAQSFDAVMALDLIEHLTKEEGKWLMQQMERVAKKKVVLFTPNGFVPQQPYDNNPYQEHKSGWDWNEMQGCGYKVLGFGGYKTLRGERAAIQYKPRIFWKYFSYFTQLFTHKNPKHAFSILCIKKLS